MTHFVYNTTRAYVPQELHVQNVRSYSLIEGAIEIAKSYDSDVAWPSEVERLSKWYEENFASGLVYDLAELFPTAPSRRFWCRALLDRARAVFSREVGDQTIEFWQARCIYEYVTMGMMLRYAAQDLDGELWSGPEPKDWRESAEYYSGH